MFEAQYRQLASEEDFRALSSKRTAQRTGGLIRVCGQEVRVRGGALRVAQREADGYESLDDPRLLVDGLRSCGTRVDLFTFMEIREANPARFDYPAEPDNLAVLPIQRSTTNAQFARGGGSRTMAKTSSTFARTRAAFLKAASSWALSSRRNSSAS